MTKFQVNRRRSHAHSIMQLTTVLSRHKVLSHLAFPVERTNNREHMNRSQRSHIRISTIQHMLPNHSSHRHHSTHLNKHMNSTTRMTTTVFHNSKERISSTPMVLLTRTFSNLLSNRRIHNRVSHRSTIPPFRINIIRQILSSSPHGISRSISTTRPFIRLPRRIFRRDQVNSITSNYRNFSTNIHGRFSNILNAFQRSIISHRLRTFKHRRLHRNPTSTLPNSDSRHTLSIPAPTIPLLIRSYSLRGTLPCSTTNTFTNSTVGYEREGGAGHTGRLFSGQGA